MELYKIPLLIALALLMLSYSAFGVIQISSAISHSLLPQPTAIYFAIIYLVSFILYEISLAFLIKKANKEAKNPYIWIAYALSIMLSFVTVIVSALSYRVSAISDDFITLLFAFLSTNILIVLSNYFAFGEISRLLYKLTQNKNYSHAYTFVIIFASLYAFAMSTVLESATIFLILGAISYFILMIGLFFELLAIAES